MNHENPPAFPYSGGNDSYGRPTSPEGMSLRDYFAGIALGSLGSYEGEIEGQKQHTAELLARKSYQWADAMLAARNGASK